MTELGILVTCQNCDLLWRRITANDNPGGTVATEVLCYLCPRCGSNAYIAGEGWLPGGLDIEAIREGVKAMEEGRVTPWEDVERELFGGWLLPEVREQARLAIGHAFHLIEHNKAMCVRCREAKQRLQAALDALEVK